MSGVIEYYFAPISGYAYLGHQALMDMAADLGAQVRFRPMEIAKVFAATGTQPPAAQSEARRSYRAEDQARWAQVRGLSVTAQPKYWPADPALACAAVLAAGAIGADQSAASFACLKAVWCDDRNIADPAHLADALAEAGQPAEEILQAARTEAMSAEVAATTQAAIDARVFGSPTYVVAGARFWGQDRLDFVRAALMRAAA